MPDRPRYGCWRKEKGQMTNLLLVVAGGAIGAGGRYLVSGWLYAQLGVGFPWGTFAVNVLGSLAIGLVSACSSKEDSLRERASS